MFFMYNLKNTPLAVTTVDVLGTRRQQQIPFPLNTSIGPHPPASASNTKCIFSVSQCVFYPCWNWAITLKVRLHLQQPQGSLAKQLLPPRPDHRDHAGNLPRGIPPVTSHLWFSKTVAVTVRCTHRSVATFKPRLRLKHLDCKSVSLKFSAGDENPLRWNVVATEYESVLLSPASYLLILPILMTSTVLSTPGRESCYLQLSQEVQETPWDQLWYWDTRQSWRRFSA